MPRKRKKRKKVVADMGSVLITAIPKGVKERFLKRCKAKGTNMQKALHPIIMGVMRDEEKRKAAFKIAVKVVKHEEEE